MARRKEGERRDDGGHHGGGQFHADRSPSSTGMIVQATIVGAFAAAIVALFGRLKLMLPVARVLDEESETDRAGRLAELKVADLFHGVPGVQVYSSLRIPDTGHRGRREIDLVLLLKRELYVLEVKNWAGIIQLQADGSWCQIRRNGTVQLHANVLEDTKHRAVLLQSYISRRGVNLPPNFVHHRVILVNPNCRPDQAIILQPEVLSPDELCQFLEKNSEKGFLRWLKAVILPGTKQEVINESTHKQLQFILSTAPTWDRLVLEGDRTVVGDFQRFKGSPEDLEALKFVKRSNVTQLLFSHPRSWLPHILGKLFGFFQQIKITVVSRDYREGNPGWSDRKQKHEQMEEIQVRPEVEIVFKVVGNSKPRNFSVKSVVTLSLSS